MAALVGDALGALGFGDEFGFVVDAADDAVEDEDAQDDDDGLERAVGLAQGFAERRALALPAQAALDPPGLVVGVDGVLLQLRVGCVSRLNSRQARW
jgi:hypothetical protein